MMEDDDWGWDISPPQMEAEESGPIELIGDVLENSPMWTEAMATELAYLCRSHSVVASAIMFAMQIARPSELALRVADDIKDMHRHQGRISGLEAYVSSLRTQMEVAETPTDENRI